MSEEKDPGCEFCNLVSKVGYKNCAQFSDEMMTAALNVMKTKVDEFKKTLQTKLDAEEISKEEFEKLSFYAVQSMGFASSALAAMMVVDAKMPPQEILRLVDDKLKVIVSGLIASKLGLPIKDLSNIGGMSVVPIPLEAIDGVMEIMQKAGIRAEVIGPEGIVASTGTTGTTGTPDEVPKKNKETDPKLN